MAHFKDIDGKEWAVKLDAPKIQQVRERLNIDLAAQDASTFSRLADDPVLLVNVLWVICLGQAERDGIKEVTFGEAIVGDVFDAASEALLDAIVAFSPQRKRELLKEAIATQAEVRDAGVTEALRRIRDPQLKRTVVAQMNAEMDSRIQKALAGYGLSIAATNSPVS